MKTDMILPVPAQPAAEAKSPAAAGSAAPPANETGGGKAADIAMVQELLRDALSVEPLGERELRIEFEKELRQIVVKVLDKETGELVRQIPIPEEISISKGLRAAIRRMAGDQSGIAVNKEI